MADVKQQLEKLRKRILAQNGTVLETVEGEVELNDVDEHGQPRKGPVLVLRSIEEGSKLTLAHPRPLTVLGSLSGQVFGAYRVKAGNLLSGRLEGARHVEIIHNMGSKGDSNVDSWIVFEATSDPGFFSQVQQGLDKLQLLEKHQQPQSEAIARHTLMRSLKNVSYDIKVFITDGRELKTVFTIQPGARGKQVKMDLMALLRYLVSKTERLEAEGNGKGVVEHFQMVLEETVSESLRVANSGGMGAALRKQRGGGHFAPQVESVCDYLLPKLLQLWLKTSEVFVQRTVDRLGKASMILKVDGQLAPFFQIEYPRWKFHVTGGKIEPERVADCNIACQLGSDQNKMRMTYNYMGGDDWISQTCDIDMGKTQTCKLILKDGSVYLTEEDNCIFGPEFQNENGQQAEEGG